MELCQAQKTAFKHVTVDTTKHFIIPTETNTAVF